MIDNVDDIGQSKPSAVVTDQTSNPDASSSEGVQIEIKKKTEVKKTADNVVSDIYLSDDESFGTTLTRCVLSY